MTKKCFAAIKSAQEVIPQIRQIAADGKPNALTEIHELANKWENDFADVDPSWKNEEESISSILKSIPSPDNIIPNQN